MEFTKTNLIFLLAALITLIAGYVLIAQGEKTYSVILLIISYVVLFPLAIAIGYFKKHV